MVDPVPKVRAVLEPTVAAVPLKTKVAVADSRAHPKRARVVAIFMFMLKKIIRNENRIMLFGFHNEIV